MGPPQAILGVVSQTLLLLVDALSRYRSTAPDVPLGLDLQVSRVTPLLAGSFTDFSPRRSARGAFVDEFVRLVHPVQLRQAWRLLSPECGRGKRRRTERIGDNSQ